MAKAEYISVVAKANAGICLFQEASESSLPWDVQKNYFTKVSHRDFTTVAFRQHEPFNYRFLETHCFHSSHIVYILFTSAMTKD